MPIYNWFKYFETKDLKYFLKKGKANIKALQQIQITLLDEFIKCFGLSESFEASFKQEKKILLLEIKYALSKKGVDKFMLGIEKKKFQLMNPVEEDQSNYMTVVTSLSNHLKREIDERTMSTKKFYTYLKSISND